MGSLDNESSMARVRSTPIVERRTLSSTQNRGKLSVDQEARSKLDVCEDLENNNLYQHRIEAPETIAYDMSSSSRTENPVFDCSTKPSRYSKTIISYQRLLHTPSRIVDDDLGYNFPAPSRSNPMSSDALAAFVNGSLTDFNEDLAKQAVADIHYFWPWIPKVTASRLICLKRGLMAFEGCDKHGELDWPDQLVRRNISDHPEQPEWPELPELFDQGCRFLANVKDPEQWPDYQMHEMVMDILVVMRR